MAVSKTSLRGADAERKGRGISMLLGPASVVLLIQIVVCVGIYQPFSKRSESTQNIASKNPIWRGTSAIRETLLQHSLSLLSEAVPNLTAPVTPDRSASAAPNLLHLPNQADNGGANGAPADANPLKVYMYTLPEKFNWGMLPEEERDKLKNFPRGMGKKAARDWLAPSDPTTYPNYGGSGARRQHSVAYYLTLSLITGLPSVQLVQNPDDAEVYFIPYFSSLSYNLFQTKLEAKGKPTDRELQESLSKYLKQQALWKKTQGRRHVIVVHHPNSLRFKMADFSNSIMIVADFGRPVHEVSNVEKDVVAPYRAMSSPYNNDTVGWSARPGLLFFMGRLQRKEGGQVREKLWELLHGQPGVFIGEGIPDSVGIAQASLQMREFRFCLMPAGDTPSSCRLFDAIMNHCVPVIISDALELPYEEVLNYAEFSITVPTLAAIQDGYLMRLLQGVTEQRWEAMWRRIKQVKAHFVYAHPAVQGGAEDMVWQAVRRKIENSNMSINNRELRIRQMKSDLERLGLNTTLPI